MMNVCTRMVFYPFVDKEALKLFASRWDFKLLATMGLFVAHWLLAHWSLAPSLLDSSLGWKLVQMKGVP